MSKDNVLTWYFAYHLSFFMKGPITLYISLAAESTDGMNIFI
jgi:hypothetical protein